MDKPAVQLPPSTAIIPTYNEATNIKRLLEEVLSISNNLNILVIDDNSPDGTGRIAENITSKEKRLTVINRPCKMGLGTAYRSGFLREISIGSSEFLIEMDADFSHDPGMIPLLVETAVKYDADLVIGSRYMEGGRIEGWDGKRFFLSRNANRLCSLLIDNRIRDYTAGFRCYRTEALKTINLETVDSDGYAFQVEMTWRFLKRSKKVIEVPITFRERSSGQSKFGADVLLEAVILLVKLFFRRLIK